MTLLVMVATSTSYYFGAQLGFELRFPQSPHSVLWPPNAILLAALLLLPTRLWWWCLAAVLPAHIAIAFPAGLHWTTVLGLYLTNTSQAVLGAVLFNRLARRYASEGAHATTIIFIVCGVFVSPIVLSFADVAVAILTRWTSNTYWQAWHLRFLSNAASAVIIVPPILATVHAYRAWQRPSLQRLTEACSLALCVAGLGSFVLLGGATLNRVLPLLVCGFLPLLLWAATRFGQVGASWALLGLVATTMGSIVRWPVGLAGQDEILMLQSIFLLISIPVLYLGALHSDLRRYVRELDATADRYHMATAAGSVGVWDWNPRTGHLFIHPHLKRLLGYNDQEIANTLDGWMRHYHPEDRERVLQLANACLRGETVGFELEHRMVNIDGGTRWLLTRGAPVHRDVGGSVRLVGTCVDITERKRIEEELRSLHLELAHLARVGMLGELSGALAHEINQPLASILSNAQAAQRLINRKAPDLAEIREAHKDIADAAKRAGNVIQQLRTMLKKGEAQVQPLDLNTVVGEVLDLVHSDLVAHQVAVVRKTGVDLPLVHGDRVQLQQVLLNFIMNACEAMSASALNERVLTITTASPDGQSVTISVVDNGRGILPELQERLFEPFVTTKKDGLGFGLSICRSIVSAHRGRLWAENNADQGAAFHVSLPPYRP
jgi:two-component system sensor kinase FixL